MLYRGLVTGCLILSGIFFLYGQKPSPEDNNQVFRDSPFVQDFSVKYYSPVPLIAAEKVLCDRNHVIQVLRSPGLMQVRGGRFLEPGQLVPDHTYRTIAHKNIRAASLYEDQFVYADEKTVFSNAWAGRLFIPHSLPKVKSIASGQDKIFLLSDGVTLQLLGTEGILWEGEADGIKDLLFDPVRNLFWVLSGSKIYQLSPASPDLVEFFGGNGMQCFALTGNSAQLAIGGAGGYFLVDIDGKAMSGNMISSLPVPSVSCMKNIGGNLWFGSDEGAFMLREDGRYNYYYGQRWLPGNQVKDISPGPENSVLILTTEGLAEIRFEEFTLAQKADYFEKQVRQRHIRLGFNATLSGMTNGDIATGYLADSDNDGLWTSMYLASQVFRYKVTGSDEALQNCRESLDAMERLYDINPVPGFPSRSFERRGYIQKLADPHRWQPAEDPEWDWKSTTSSDEAIGHIFVFGVLAELIEDEDIRQRSVRLIDTLMQHIVDHDFYLVDYDGKPTTWGRWNPEYVNARPKMVGDRKLNASNIIGMLQTAYHFTGKEIYREKAYELMEDHGYLENLLRPIDEIGMAPDDADDWSKMLSENWNHSDDEMYFLGYWGLYRYAFDKKLKAQYKEAIIDHWEAERPEKEGLWNIMTALVGAEDFDLEEAIWYLQEYPLDLVTWTVKNSHRKDIIPVEPDFRGQTLTEVLPPDELPVSRHNANRFRLDGGNGGRSEYSAGDIWLLPYWMGRYLGVITE